MRVWAFSFGVCKEGRGVARLVGGGGGVIDSCFFLFLPSIISFIAGLIFFLSFYFLIALI